jgi:glycyl-tRNA synthetase beta chain
LDSIFSVAGVPLPKSLAEFLLARLRASLTGEGHATDLVDAVMATGGADVASITARVHGLSALPKDEMAAVRITFRRVAGLGRDHSAASYSLDLLTSEADRQLHLAVQALPADDSELLVALRNLRPVVDQFFANVMVMCDDLPLRENRLGLLRSILERFSGFADFARLGGD